MLFEEMEPDLLSEDFMSLLKNTSRKRKLRKRQRFLKYNLREASYEAEKKRMQVYLSDIPPFMIRQDPVVMIKRIHMGLYRDKKQDRDRLLSYIQGRERKLHCIYFMVFFDELYDFLSRNDMLFNLDSFESTSGIMPADFVIMNEETVEEEIIPLDFISMVIERWTSKEGFRKGSAFYREYLTQTREEAVHRAFYWLFDFQPLVPGESLYRKNIIIEEEEMVQ